jgi:hypothetical protein
MDITGTPSEQLWSMVMSYRSRRTIVNQRKRFQLNEHVYAQIFVKEQMMVTHDMLHMQLGFGHNIIMAG